MTDYNTKGLNTYQASEDKQAARQGFDEYSSEQAQNYFAGKFEELDGDNLNAPILKIGRRAQFSFLELATDYLGEGKALDAKFAAMLKTEQGKEFLDELATLLGDAFPEAADIFGED